MKRNELERIEPNVKKKCDGNETEFKFLNSGRNICLIFGIFHVLWWFSWMFSLLSSVDLSKQSARELVTTCVSLSIWICIWILYRSNRHLVHQIIYLCVCQEKTSKNHSSTHIWVVWKRKSKLETEIQRDHSRVFYISCSFFLLNYLDYTRTKWSELTSLWNFHPWRFVCSFYWLKCFFLFLAFSQFLVRCCISRARSRTHAHWQSQQIGQI